MWTHDLPCVTHAFAFTCHVTHGLPCVTHAFTYACFVTYGLPCITHAFAYAPVVSKNMKFRLYWNSRKFAWAIKFCMTNPIMRFVSSFEIYKTYRFSTCIVAISSSCLPHFFGKTQIYSGFTAPLHNKPMKPNA